MSEQRTTSVFLQQYPSQCPHPGAVGERWGDPINDVRKAELQGYLDAWAEEKADHGKRKGPFAPERLAFVPLSFVRLAGGRPAGVQLTGADVSWLAERSERETYGVPNLHLEGANLGEAHLEGAVLHEAHLETLYVNTCEWVGSDWSHE